MVRDVLLVVRALSMILVALGTIDYIARIVADVLRTVYFAPERAPDREQAYFVVAWLTIAGGSAIRCQASISR